MFSFAVAGLAMLATAGLDVQPPDVSSPSSTLTAAQLFSFADAARDRGDFTTATTAYKALATNPDADLRNEARFRLALMLADKQHRPRDAAVELRRILDEKPKAARVRLELARIQASLGHLGLAQRELRAAQASGGLPPDVERMVRFYAAALHANKPWGGGLEVTLAPDSNINRATRSDTLGTVLGKFTLDDDARARSGLGLSLRGQTYARAPLSRHVSLVVRASWQASLYRAAAFNDVLAGVQAGPELVSGQDRLSLTLGPSWRWFGGVPYSVSLGGDAAFQHPLGTRVQWRLEGGVAHTANLFNALQTGMTSSLTTGYDRALSARLGGGAQLSISRTAARDPGFSDVTAGGSLFAFREIGGATLVLNGGYSRLEADARLLLYPRRRVDDRFTASASLTWRRLHWKGLSPLTRLRWERNRSTIELYDYRRISGEIGITSAF
jgi:outer membrane protein